MMVCEGAAPRAAACRARRVLGPGVCLGQASRPSSYPCVARPWPPSQECRVKHPGALKGTEPGVSVFRPRDPILRQLCWARLQNRRDQIEQGRESERYKQRQRKTKRQRETKRCRERDRGRSREGQLTVLRTEQGRVGAGEFRCGGRLRPHPKQSEWAFDPSCVGPRWGPVASTHVLALLPWVTFGGNPPLGDDVRAAQRGTSCAHSQRMEWDKTRHVCAPPTTAQLGGLLWLIAPPGASVSSSELWGLGNTCLKSIPRARPGRAARLQHKAWWGSPGGGCQKPPPTLLRGG